MNGKIRASAMESGRLSARGFNAWVCPTWESWSAALAAIALPRLSSFLNGDGGNDESRTGSAHHHPARAFARSPTSSATDKYAQIMFWPASLTVADELSWRPT